MVHIAAAFPALCQLSSLLFRKALFAFLPSLLPSLPFSSLVLSASERLLPTSQCLLQHWVLFHTSGSHTRETMQCQARVSMCFTSACGLRARPFSQKRPRLVPRGRAVCTASLSGHPGMGLWAASKIEPPRAVLSYTWAGACRCRMRLAVLSGGNPEGEQRVAWSFCFSV